MKMVRHHNKTMQQKPLRSISAEHLNEKLRPTIVSEERLPPSGIRRHEVRLSVRRRHLPIWPHTFPRGLKPQPVLLRYGATKAAPFQNPYYSFTTVHSLFNPL